MSAASGKTATPLQLGRKTRASRATGPKRYATMDDVAAATGVHPTTVSMALRAHPSIPACTRERILVAAKRIGYLRDPLLDAFNFHRLQKLAIKQPPSIAFVTDAQATPYFFGSTYHPLVYEGVRAAAEAQHLTVEIFPLGQKDMTASRLNTIIASRGISGILLSTFTPMTRLIDFDWEKYSAVKIESHHLLGELDVISNDQCQAARLCMRRLRELGYRRIGLATARDDESRLLDNFSSGVLVEQAALPAEECVPSLLFDRADLSQIAAQIAAWAKAHQVDAVMSNWHELLPASAWDGKTARLAGTKLCVPRDVAFASLDVPADRPDLGGIIQNHRLVGMRAMEQLAVLVKTNHRGSPANPSATYVPGYWRDGASVPLKRKRS